MVTRDDPLARRRTRVALLLDEPVVPAWLHRIIQDIEQSPTAELALTLLDVSAAVSRRRTPALAVYEALDRRLFRLPDDHAARVDARPLLAGVRPVRLRWTAYGCELEAADLEALRRAAPDLILKLGFPRLSGEVLKIAPLGVWSFDHLERSRDGTPPHIWEMLRGERLFTNTLRAATAAGSRVLAHSWWPVDPTSLQRMRNGPAWDASRLVARALDEANGPALADGANFDPAPLELPRRAPNLFELARFLGGVARRVARNRYSIYFSNNVWFIALRGSSGSLVDGSLDGFRAVPQPPDRYYADPMLVEDGGRTWLFFEDVSIETSEGEIRCAEVRDDGTLGESRIVLAPGHHVSYPFVFRRDGEWFMLPETSSCRTVELWRAVEFPWHWKRERALLSDLHACDPTLLEHAGRLWLFVSTRPEGGAPGEELSLFHADSLEGPWHPHALNPIVRDPRRARPAGPLFVEDGRLYRPAQDCAGKYGAEIHLLRVEQLDESAYRETLVRTIEPDWWPDAHSTHTLGRAGGFDAIDGRLWLRRGRSLV